MKDMTLYAFPDGKDKSPWFSEPVFEAKDKMTAKQLCDMVNTIVDSHLKIGRDNITQMVEWSKRGEAT